MYGLSSASVNAGVCRSVNGHYSAIGAFSSDTLKKSESRGSEATGLVSILTSDTKYSIALPSSEYLRLKRLQKSVRVSGEVVQELLQKNHVRYKAAMVTLTYRPDVDWSPRQVSNYLKCVREWARRKGIFVHYVWVLELTKKGRPHYHVLFWLPKGVSMPKADKQGWWKHGMTNSQWAHSPIGYLCKYTSKGVDFDSWGKLPKGGRLYGQGGFTPKMRLTRAWRVAPAWVRELIDECDGVKKVGNYWVNIASNMGISSPFVFDSTMRVLRWKGFSDPVDMATVESCLPDNSDWVKVRFSEYVDGVRFGGYYDAIDAGFDAVSSMTT